MNDGKITGTLETKRGDQEATTTDLKNVELVGNKLLFEVSARFGEREFPVHYQGVVKDGGITGWQMMFFGRSQRDFAWKAELKKRP